MNNLEFALLELDEWENGSRDSSRTQGPDGTFPRRIVEHFVDHNDAYCFDCDEHRVKNADDNPAHIESSRPFPWLP